MEANRLGLFCALQNLKVIRKSICESIQGGTFENIPGVDVVNKL